ncbi:type II secretion system protein GspM [Paraferrimonas haliotis]|uniref:Type II secretion system protein M n=1 Tax=Paraferrimonas haliotis TaxID=2013866 RepID=A0AA37WY90_9GAMM|nr:type II secretion system protein M [Paraferrimonas haliotis]GLS83465.1 type II secretion system protein M [Paraferrimonas haliotis]
MKEWWNNLDLRERKLAIVAAIFVAIGVLYWGVWQPVANGREAAETRYNSQQRLLEHVQQTANQIASIRASGGNQGTRSGSLQSIASRTAPSYQLSITRFNPSNNKLQLSMDDAPFDNLANWLAVLVNQYGVVIDNVEVTETDIPGVVRIRRLTLAK